MNYTDKLGTLKDIFGSNEIILETNCLAVDDHIYPILDDVIILLDPSQYPNSLKSRLEKRKEAVKDKATVEPSDFAEDIQFTFGEEWQRFPDLLPEHKQEFLQYFDLINLSELRNNKVCDLGCGIGRWSFFLSDKCRELILVDFSEAIFVARRNLAKTNNTLFFMGDLKKLPFRNDFADFLFCLGVLHHLPTSAIDEVRTLKRYAPQLLVYLYYALDNRPFYYRILLSLVTKIRLMVATQRNPIFREVFTWFCTIGIYLPLLALGKALRPLGISHYIPLYEGYQGKSINRIRQDVYDRFFTRIEQRYSKKQIMTLKDTFTKITVSDNLPYWHFICQK
ncbi:MAG: class I SAM-dependent methyltransferase [Euryarchaeota archaeon]|nr:class I SAM-dependent methyltransferase [Euryarchaeota archaeon]